LSITEFLPNFQYGAIILNMRNGFSKNYLELMKRESMVIEELMGTKSMID